MVASSKTITQANAQIQLSQVREVSTSLTAGQKRRLQPRLDALQIEFDRHSQKVKRMWSDLSIEAGTAVKFQLEQQLLEEEAQLAHLSDELDQIESALAS